VTCLAQGVNEFGLVVPGEGLLVDPMDRVVIDAVLRRICMLTSSVQNNFSLNTGCGRVPNPSISTSTTSPALSQTGGFWQCPPQVGPVKIMSPGAGLPPERYTRLTHRRRKTHLLVLLFCIVLPLSRSRMPGHGDRVPRRGEPGWTNRANVSKVLPASTACNPSRVAVACGDIVADHVAASTHWHFHAGMNSPSCSHQHEFAS